MEEWGRRVWRQGEMVRGAEKGERKEVSRKVGQ